MAPGAHTPPHTMGQKRCFWNPIPHPAYTLYPYHLPTGGTRGLQSAAHWADGLVGASLKAFLSPASFLPVRSTTPHWGPPCQAPGACQQPRANPYPPPPRPSPHCPVPTAPMAGPYQPWPSICVPSPGPHCPGPGLHPSPPSFLAARSVAESDSSAKNWQASTVAP